MQGSKDVLYRVSSSIRELSGELEHDGRSLEQLGNQLARSGRFSFLPGRGVDETELWMIEDRLELGDYSAAIDIAENYVNERRYLNLV